MDLKRFVSDIDLSWLRSLSYLWFMPPALLIGGFQELYTSVRHPVPGTYTVSEYLHNRPTNKWLILTEANVELALATPITVPLIGIVTDVYIPVIASENSGHCISPDPAKCSISDSPPPFQLLIATTNRRIINQVTSSTQPQIHSILAESPVTFSGMVKFGISGLTSDRQRWLEEIYGDRLADNIVIIDLDARPNLFRAFAFLAGGVVVGAWLLGPRRPKQGSALSETE